MAMFTNDPFRGIEHMMDQAMRAAATGSSMGMDLYRTDDNFIAKFDMPGVSPESIDIDIDQNTLTVRASRESEKGDTIKWLSRERFVGTFARQLNLGYGLDTSKITADYTDGVLTLTIPVAEESKPRKVTVSHAGAQKVIDGASSDQSTAEEAA
ncbi:MAG: Hsp20/alpha crystallin family protein [Actinomycetaceae bacterium]|nr:Hsp20/alpha crystallin family protein [Arcanobacterium sp.]MDD7686300.1 Hsp20/alpha crystallin family protein [Actinomycetaceae bacterium]MDY5274157.1 Hsp20/alpha crystallin family protein [Arcanobacterium sp.]